MAEQREASDAILDEFDLAETAMICPMDEFGRTPGCVSFMQGLAPSTKKIFLPTERQDVVEDVMDHIGVAVAIEKPHAGESTGASVNVAAVTLAQQQVNSSDDVNFKDKARVSSNALQQARSPQIPPKLTFGNRTVRRIGHALLLQGEQLYRSTIKSVKLNVIAVVALVLFAVLIVFALLLFPDVVKHFGDPSMTSEKRPTTPLVPRTRVSDPLAVLAQNMAQKSASAYNNTNIAHTSLGIDDSTSRTPVPTSSRGAPRPNTPLPVEVVPQSPHVRSHGTGYPPRSPMVKQQIAKTFCPELVVPRSCECLLIVPIRPLTAEPFHIKDLKGNVVLKVMRQIPEGEKFDTSKATDARLVITTGQGDMLSQCCLMRMDDKKEFHLFDASENHFATLMSDEVQQRTTLTTMTGTRYDFWGYFDLHAVNVMDDENRFCASTEMCTADFDPTGDYYRLRAAPLTDVGLIICSLLCIEHFQ